MEINRRWFGITSEDEDDAANTGEDPEAARRAEEEAWEARRKAREEVDREMEEMRQRVSASTTQPEEISHSRQNRGGDIC